LLGHFFDAFAPLHHRDHLFDDAVNQLIFDLYVVLHLSCIAVFNNRHDFLDHSLNLHHLHHLHYSLYDLFDEHGHLDDLFHYFFHRDNFLYDHLYFLVLMLDVVDHSFHLNCFFHLYDLLSDHLHLH